MVAYFDLTVGYVKLIVVGGRRSAVNEVSEGRGAGAAETEAKNACVKKHLAGLKIRLVLLRGDEMRMYINLKKNTNACNCCAVGIIEGSILTETTHALWER